MTAGTLVMPSATELEDDYQDGHAEPITAIFYRFDPTTSDVED